MGYTRQNGGAAIVAAAMAQVGKPYSEFNPPGSWFNGQDWHPGLSIPTYFDCDGLVYYSCLAGAGITISNGTAAAQWAWAQSMGLVIPSNVPLQFGDITCFFGATGGPGNPGHTGIVANPSNSTIVNAYDRAHGVCVLPFQRFQPTNGTNGLGWVGAYRPVNLLPLGPGPAPNPQEDTVGRRLVKDPSNPWNGGWWLVDEDRKCGVPNPTDLETLQAEGIPTAVLTPAELAGLTTVQWGQI